MCSDVFRLVSPDGDYPVSNASLEIREAPRATQIQPGAYARYQRSQIGVAGKRQGTG